MSRGPTQFAALLCVLVGSLTIIASSASGADGDGALGSLERCPQALCQERSPDEIGALAAVSFVPDAKGHDQSELLKLLNRHALAAVALPGGLDIETIVFIVLAREDQDTKHDLHDLLVVVHELNRKSESGKDQIVAQTTYFCRPAFCSFFPEPPQSG
jgi:hypothetical protein